MKHTFDAETTVMHLDAMLSREDNGHRTDRLYENVIADATSEQALRIAVWHLRDLHAIIRSKNISLLAVAKSAVELAMAEAASRQPSSPQAG